MARNSAGKECHKTGAQKVIESCILYNMDKVGLKIMFGKLADKIMGIKRTMTAFIVAA